MSPVIRSASERSNTPRVTASEGVSNPFGKVFTPKDLAELWQLSEQSIRRLFQDQPGVFILGDDNPRGRRGHTRQQELEYARATAAADEKALSDKIANLEALKNYQTLNALYAEADKTDLEIHQAKAELLKQQVDDQTKLNDLASEWRRQMTNEALDMVSGNLAKDVTGQHKQAHWGQDMKNIGGNMVQSAIKSALQMGLKKIGTKQNPAYVIVVGGTPMANPLASLPGVGQLPPALGGALKAGGGFLGGLLGKLFGSGVGSSSSSIQFMADGGDTYPGRSYVVGDGGEPEMFTPGVRGTITPFSKMGRGNVTYNISAPNGQLGVENRIARAMEYTHNSAVSSSVRADSERAKRTPKRSN